MRWLDCISDSMNMNLSKLWETVEDRGDWHATVHGVTVRHRIEQQQIIISTDAEKAFEKILHSL